MTGGPYTVVCFAGVDWDSHPQRPQLLMASLAKLGHQVVYVDNLGVRMPRLRDAKRVGRRMASWLKAVRRSAPCGPPGLRVVSPIIVPWHRWGIARRLARRMLVRRLRQHVPPDRHLVVWTYLPLPVITDVAEDLDANLLVYDWCDDAAARVMTRSHALRRQITRWEDDMASRADLLVVASGTLLKRRDPSNPRTHLVPHGARSLNGAHYPLLAEVAKLPHPRIGFVGSISEWIDLDLVNGLARARPEWSFVMVGPVKTSIKNLRNRANVLFTGERSYDEIPTLLSAFDCAIIPYRVTPAIEAASPLKLREYLVNGLPVVSVDIPDVRAFSSNVRIASGQEEFLAALEGAMEEPRNALPESALWSWDECAASISSLIQGALLDRSMNVAGTIRSS